MNQRFITGVVGEAEGLDYFYNVYNDFLMWCTLAEIKNFWVFSYNTDPYYCCILI